MCGKSQDSMRDREFDSNVRADIDASKATGVASDYGNTVTDESVENGLINEVMTQNLAQIEQRMNCADLHREAVANQQAQGLPNDDTPVAIVDDEVGSQTAQLSPFAGARDALRDVMSSDTVSEATRKANTYVESILSPYYQGRGDFNHVSFLNDLEASKGSKLNEGELRFFGHVIGSYCGNKAAQEYVAAVKSGDLDEAIAIQRAIAAR